MKNLMMNTIIMSKKGTDKYKCKNMNKMKIG